ncbi:MAG TPA: hypothetical protein VII77_02530, partial [Candidatus Deferrimicrobium sp.]
MPLEKWNCPLSYPPWNILRVCFLSFEMPGMGMPFAGRPATTLRRLGREPQHCDEMTGGARNNEHVPDEVIVTDPL